MFFAANIAVEQDVFVLAAIAIVLFLFTRF